MFILYLQIFGLYSQKVKRVLEGNRLVIRTFVNIQMDLVLLDLTEDLGVYRFVWHYDSKWLWQIYALVDELWKNKVNLIKGTIK